MKFKGTKKYVSTEDLSMAVMHLSLLKDLY